MASFAQIVNQEIFSDWSHVEQEKLVKEWRNN